MDPEGMPTAIDARLLGGLALIDRGEFYEAHELLEDLWMGEVGSARHVLQALIQFAVALHHRGNGNLGGARSLLERAIEHCAAAEPVTLGVDARALGRCCARLRDEAAAVQTRMERDRLEHAPELDRSTLPRFDALRAAIREARRGGGLDPDPPIELPPA
jgi:predicted metal-dependent hydrolase